ncbi:hypothetical protein NQ317_007866, partial [Molorchus minor]
MLVKGIGNTCNNRNREVEIKVRVTHLGGYLLEIATFSKNHVLADPAFVHVSRVVKVLEAIINSTVSGSTSFSTSAKWVPSMLDTKCNLSPWLYGFKASVTMTGPRSDPPIPMFTTSYCTISGLDVRRLLLLMSELNLQKQTCDFTNYSGNKNTITSIRLQILFCNFTLKLLSNLLDLRFVGVLNQSVK